MSNLKPLKLHEIIGTSTVWTDELWDEALAYLLQRVGTREAVKMALFLLLPNGKNLPDYPHKIDFLREFRKYPPTLLLGIFDVVRMMRG
jgi:hypothetical protein